MQSCELSHIPKELHTEERPVTNTFVVGEHLYRRCSPVDLENPFKTITPVELSHNRSGEKDCLSSSEDVLYNITSDGTPKYEDQVVCTLKIVDLTEDSLYIKPYEESKENTKTKEVTTYKATLELLHEPAPCMYPHCVFRVTLDGTVINYKNYSDTLKKTNRIRNSIKEEIASMILTRKVSQNSEPDLNKLS